MRDSHRSQTEPPAIRSLSRDAFHSDRVISFRRKGGICSLLAVTEEQIPPLVRNDKETNKKITHHITSLKTFRHHHRVTFVMRGFVMHFSLDIVFH
jgi:hypothetical protein